METTEQFYYSNVVIEEPEFRLYYDDDGKVLFYTCEKPIGNYLVIDSLTFAQARPDLRVIDGKLSSINPKAIISKLKPHEDGIMCAMDDVSILANDYAGPVTKWKLSVHELR